MVLAHDLSPYLYPTSAAAMVATDRHEPIIVSFQKKKRKECVNQCLMQSKQVYADLPATLFFIVSSVFLLFVCCFLIFFFIAIVIVAVVHLLCL